MLCGKFVFFCSLVLPMTWCSSLNFIIPARQTECVYLYKEKGDSFSVFVQILSGQSKIDLFCAGPPSAEHNANKENEFYFQQNGISDYGIERIVNKTGSYECCAANSYSYSDDVVVSFTYDPVEIEPELKFKKQLKMEKREFVLRMLNRVKPILDEHQIKMSEDIVLGSLAQQRERETQIAINEGYAPNTADELKTSLMFLSLLADRMLRHLEAHKKKSTHHIHVQESNASQITFYSLLLCILNIALSGGQIVIVKRFFQNSKA